MSNEEIHPIKRFFKLLRVEKQEITGIYIYALFYGLIVLTLPLGIQAIINFITGGEVSTAWMVLVGIVILGIAFSGVMQIMQLVLSENLQQKIFTRSAFEFAFRIPRIKLEGVDKIYMPELVNRFFDTLSVQKGLSKILIDFSSASLQVIFGLILLSIYHPFFILLSVLLTALIYLIFRFTAPLGLKTSILESKRKYEVVYWLEEVARSMETFKLSGDSPLPMNRTDELVEGYLDSRKAHFRTLLVKYIALVAFKVVIAAGLLLIGGLLVINQEMDIGQFVAAEIIIILVLASSEKLILAMETIYDVLTALEKIGYVTDLPLENDQGESQGKESNKGFSIHLKNFTYRFPDQNRNLLDIKSLVINSGEKLCLSGKSGLGKSLFLKLLGGLYTDFGGSLSFDRIPLGNWGLDDLRKQIGDNLARDSVFQGTLAENIGLGRENVKSTEIQKLAELVGLESFVEDLSLGYNAPLMSEGMNLPKSIRIKIGIARALVGNPKLILIDSGINELPSQDQNRILNFLFENDSTVILISNDWNMISKFPRTLLLGEGVQDFQRDEIKENKALFGETLKNL